LNEKSFERRNLFETFKAMWKVPMWELEVGDIV